MGKVTKVHEQALTASTTEALMAVYDDWAANYDHDLMDNWGYSTPARVADFLKRYLTVDDALILDAGCGTGLVGTALVANGLSRLEGLDVSQSMLHEAAKKAIYTQLHCADMISAALRVPARRCHCVGTLLRRMFAPKRSGNCCGSPVLAAWSVLVCVPSIGKPQNSGAY